MQELISADKLASRLQWTRDHIYRLCREGKLPHTRINARTTRFGLDEIEAWIASGRQPIKKREGAK
jgi:excisionase family DNA binding protein